MLVENLVPKLDQVPNRIYLQQNRPEERRWLQFERFYSMNQSIRLPKSDRDEGRFFLLSKMWHTSTRMKLKITAAIGLPRRVVPLQIQRKSNPRKNIRVQLMQKNVVPKISSFETAWIILDAPIRPERHAEKTARIVPMITIGFQILMSDRNE